VNVSHAQRAAFEATLSEENRRSIHMYSPSDADAGPIPAAAWYATNIYTTTGAEAFAGFDAIRPAWTWSAYPPTRDLQLRISRAGRVLSSPPLGLSTAFQNSMFYVFQTPVYLDAARWAF
jgi:hypothetical protein